MQRTHPSQSSDVYYLDTDNFLSLSWPGEHIVKSYYLYMRIMAYFTNHRLAEIPNDIVELCLIFLNGSFDRFDPNYINWKNMKLNKEKGLLKQFVDLSLATAFLERIAEKGMHTWKFNVVKGKTLGGGLINIGIWDIGTNEKPSVKHLNTSLLNRDEGYGISLSCPMPIIVEMELHFGYPKEATLVFNVNGKEFKRMSCNVSKYVAVVQLYRCDDEIQLLSYEQGCPGLPVIKH